MERRPNYFCPLVWLGVRVGLFLWLVLFTEPNKDDCLPSDKDLNPKSLIEYILLAVGVVVVAVKKSHEIIIV